MMGKAPPPGFRIIRCPIVPGCWTWERDGKQCSLAFTTKGKALQHAWNRWATEPGEDAASPTRKTP